MHKEECKKRAAEIFDEALYTEPQKEDDCPVCFLPLPFAGPWRKYQPCCGKTICVGCIHEVYKDDNRIICPFCRTPQHTSERELIRRVEKRVEAGDAHAIYQLGCHYSVGDLGLQQDVEKANKLWLQAAGLGDARACNKFANSYLHGEGVERDVEKAKYYFERAAMKGDAV